MSVRSNSFRLILFVLLWVHSPEPARAESWTVDVRKRQEERKQEKWYFAEHLGHKSASARQDVMYRFFLGKREPKPRLELIAFAKGVAGLQERRGEDTPEIGNGERFHGIGYGARLAFNNFLAAATGLPTLNMVPNLFADVLDLSSSGSIAPSTNSTVGGGFRLFGLNPEDSAVYLDYSRREISLVTSPVYLNPSADHLSRAVFRGWVGSLSAQFYLFPILALQGGLVLPENIISGHDVSQDFTLEEFHYGGQLDLSMFRLEYTHSQRKFSPKQGSHVEDEIIQSVHQIALALLF